MTEEETADPASLQPRDAAVGPGPDRRDRLAARDSRRETGPVRVLASDLGRRPAVVLAVIPFHQVGLDVALIAEAGQLAVRRARSRGLVRTF